MSQGMMWFHTLCGWRCQLCHFETLAEHLLLTQHLKSQVQWMWCSKLVLNEVNQVFPAPLAGVFVLNLSKCLPFFTPTRLCCCLNLLFFFLFFTVLSEILLRGLCLPENVTLSQLRWFNLLELMSKDATPWLSNQRKRKKYRKILKIYIVF